MEGYVEIRFDSLECLIESIHFITRISSFVHHIQLKLSLRTIRCIFFGRHIIIIIIINNNYQMHLIKYKLDIDE